MWDISSIAEATQAYRVLPVLPYSLGLGATDRMR